jgi:hypothetical protein
MSRTYEHLDVRTEDDRTIVLPEAEPASVDAIGRDRVPWVVAAAVGAVVLVVVALFALTLVEGEDPATEDVPGVDNPASPPTDVPVPTAAPNASLALGTAESFASTVLVGDDRDLFDVLATDPSRFAGAPVNGDAPEVRQVFGDDAFSVTDATGRGPILVFVPGATDELEGFLPGTKVLFVGTVHPTPADLGSFLGAGPAAIADATGVYVVAVPETVMHITPPTA